MNQIFIRQDFVEDLGYQGFSVLAGLLLNARKQPMGKEWVCISPVEIAGVLMGREPTESDLQAVNKGFRDLTKLNILEKYVHGQYVVHYPMIERNEGKYVFLKEDEIRTILNFNEGVNRFSLLQYFAYLKSTFDFKTRVGNSSLTYLQEGSGKSLLTISKYHQALEGIGVLKVFRFKPIPLSGGSFTYPKNVYCSPEDEESAMKFIIDSGKFGVLKLERSITQSLINEATTNNRNEKEKGEPL